MDARVVLKCGKVCEVGDMPRPYNGYIDLPYLRCSVLTGQSYRVFFFYCDVLEVGNNTQNGYSR